MPPVASRFRDPSTIFFQNDSVRRCIIASYWIIIVLAIPLWWKTTSIERLGLPTSQVYAEAEKKLRIPLSICLDEIFIDEVAKVMTGFQDTAEYLDVKVTAGWECNQSNSSSDYTVAWEDKLEIQDRTLYHPLSGSLTNTLKSLLAPQIDPRAAQYAPRYRLSFTLLNEDGSAGQVVNGWDIQEAIQRHVSPITSALSMLHNFTIESQVQFHAPLAFEPQSLSEGAYGLTPEDLTVFVNSAEWTLSSSSSNDPVLHFVLFVPSAERRPLRILNEDGTPSTSSAFLIPQWGGIVILNLPSPSSSQDESPSPSERVRLTADDLRQSFGAFSRQMTTLLGVPKLPPAISVSSSSPSSSSSFSTPFTHWQIDTLLRLRTHENIRRSQDTLRSTVKVVDEIEGMPVGEEVQNQVRGSLGALKHVLEILSDDGNTQLTATPNTPTSQYLSSLLAYSARALTLSSKAFFNPGMLAMLYFPAEHKYAVYTPLFASAMIPLVVAAMREVKAWMKERKEKRAALGGGGGEVRDGPPEQRED
ncbi:hypothetical protein D9757_006732 [Collybiopsis confluens]|uniref:GPI transamidase component PIG-S n=1 Tax=Collybiopsis confluens TaxID=2823264 RepID=A0A8H5HLI6_9AGAR|nr:hypothetical protein D9757_006732 [Collybiopsis confluens]